MNASIIEKIRSQVASGLRLVPMGDEYLRIGTPIIFDDGDRCSLFLSRRDKGWVLTDRGSVASRASYVETNLLSSGYRPRFEKLIEFFGMREEAGEIIMPIVGDDFADAIFTFAQGAVELVRLADTPSETHRKTEKRFHHKLVEIIRAVAPGAAFEENWHDAESDPDRIYPVDCRLKAHDDSWWYLFGISTPAKCLHAAITCMHYRLEQVAFRGLAVYKNRESLAKSATLPLDKVVERTFDAEEASLRDFVHSLAG